jgi:hypothetical protein
LTIAPPARCSGSARPQCDAARGLSPHLRQLCVELADDRRHDPATGREIWRTRRTERFNWAAPHVAQHGRRRQIIVNGETVRLYEFETGQSSTWGDRLDVLATNTFDNQSFIASPVIVDGTIYLRSRTHLFAIR